MPKERSTAVDLARDVHMQLSGGALTPAIAKLYSHYTRISSGRPGLTYWRPDEAEERLADAARLIDAALLKREATDDDWHLGMRRAGEILEWLTHPQFKIGGAPIRLLASAAYQLAGYPAMAASLLDRTSPTEYETRLIPPLLKADFVGLLKALRDFWREQLRERSDAEENLTYLPSTESLYPQDFVVRQISAGLGILCAEARWGNELRLGKAIQQLHTISTLMLHGGDTYSWILSRLVTEIARTFQGRLLRNHLNRLESQLGSDGKEALELYARYAYREQKAVIWPSQELGLERLNMDGSFALCTPTGSGKTTVAEVALLRSLFKHRQPEESLEETVKSSPLAMYLVPSKALAAEAESKLQRILTRVSTENDPITVTGLYGGSDWGPTDAWLTRTGKTVLICTYEKADAILRFLGPLILDRLRLVVIDEAHSVGFDGRRDVLQMGENRSLRLESLGCRLLSHVSRNDTEVIALSAVAGGMESSLASWISGKEARAESSSYRSTRQLIGRLECLRNRRFEIQYDLLDGSSLRFSERGATETPFITDPFPPFAPTPELEKSGPEKRLRPYLFWAALHLVKSTATQGNASVLVFVPQQIGGYAADLLSLLDGDWAGEDLPQFFEPPKDADRSELWQRCLDSCLDYFTQDSNEYRLLQRGIVVHHGRMPRLLSRLLVEVIEERIVNVVLSTSTLSEGVNLPFEVLLVPSLRRGQQDVPLREFKNLAGRTGRPGVATEGRTLVLLPNDPTDYSSARARERYFEAIGFFSLSQDGSEQSYLERSPLAELIALLRDNWKQISGSSGDSFLEWLESASPLEEREDPDPALQSLDVLDAVLLSAIVELEQLTQKSIDPADLEERLREIWGKTFAHYSSSQESMLSDIFVARGKAVSKTVYPEEEQRRRFYKTSLPPRSARKLMELCSEARDLLEPGASYALWSREEQFNYIRRIVDLVRRHPTFATSEKLGNAKTAPRWDQVLEWWLNRHDCKQSPKATRVSDWYNFVYHNFDYRFSWGLSSILSLELDDATENVLRPLTLDDWPKTGLPWIAFWIKELVVWGTLDPAVSFLLSKRFAWTRFEAEKKAKLYYRSNDFRDPNERLNPSNVLEWAEERLSDSKIRKSSQQLHSYNVELLRDFSKTPQSEWFVLPVEKGQHVLWLDASGSPLAGCARPAYWSIDDAGTYDYRLFTDQKIVRTMAYL